MSVSNFMRLLYFIVSTLLFLVFILPLILTLLVTMPWLALLLLVLFIGIDFDNIDKIEEHVNNQNKE